MTPAVHHHQPRGEWLIAFVFFAAIVLALVIAALVLDPLLAILQ